MNTTTTKPPYATVYNIPERPRPCVHKPSPLRYEEYPTIIVSDADEEYCLTGYGEISVSEHDNATETSEDKQKLRVPRLKYPRPRARCQTTKSVSNPLEPVYFRNVIQATSDDPTVIPGTDFRKFFENLLRKPPPTRRRQRTLILSTSPASEAIDARPRSN